MKKIRMVCLVSLIFFIAGCSQSPLQKLASDTIYADMDNAYWANQHDKKTKLWTEAVNYCTPHGDKPNCGAVMTVFIITNGSTDVPAYGTSGHPISSPKF